MRSSMQSIPGWILSIIMVLIIGFVIAQNPAPEVDKGVKEVQRPKVSNTYVAAVQSQQLIYLSGKGARLQNGKYLTGKLGKELKTKQGYDASRNIGLDHLAELKGMLGDLSKVKRIVKVSVFVNSTPDFIDQSQVANGFSDLMLNVFGERGRHARTSIGVASLPQNMAVEIDMIVEVKP